jgi:hypothetical protein
VAKDDDLRFRIKLRQTSDSALVELAVICQPHPLGHHIQALEEEAKQPGPVAVGKHDVAAGELELDHGWQHRAAIGEVLDVKIPSHSVHRRDGPQGLQRCRVIHVTSVQDQVHSGQRIERGFRQPLQAMGNVGIGEQADSKGRHYSQFNTGARLAQFLCRLDTGGRLVASRSLPCRAHLWRRSQVSRITNGT